MLVLHDDDVGHLMQTLSITIIIIENETNYKSPLTITLTTSKVIIIGTNILKMP